MRAGTITAPLSRTPSRQKRPNILLLSFIAITILLSFGGTILLAAHITQNHIESHNPHEIHESPPSNNRQLKQSQHSLQSKHTTNNNNRNVNIHDPPSNPIPINPSEAQGLLIHATEGIIRIWFRPDLSGPSSIDYITQVVARSLQAHHVQDLPEVLDTDGRESNEGRHLWRIPVACEKCKFYRAEPGLLLQGIFADSFVMRNKELGGCPVKDYKPKLECPKHDPNCGCHGPVMTKGMVGWAGGGGGPDFFINTHPRVDWWENQHTVWGEIRDEESLHVIDTIYDKPAHMTGMRMLDDEIHFLMELF